MGNTETDYDELRSRVHYINQCSELESLAKSAEKAFMRENPKEARDKLHKLREHVDTVLDGLEGDSSGSVGSRDAD